MGGDPPRPIRLATYNVEWFNALFDDAGHPQDDAEPSHRYGISRDRQLAALRKVFAALDADGIMVIEAPDTGSRRSTVTALERFAASAGIRAKKALVGFPSETEQEIAFLYDPDRVAARHDPQGAPSPPRGAHGCPRFDTTFRYDLDADGVSEQIRFSKPPLEVALAVPGRDLRLIGVHAKSKAAHGHHSPAEFLRLSIDNRRKQLAECIWLRQRVDIHLDSGDSVIVMGDLNDGPGLDEYEKLFGRSGVEVVLGTTLPAERQLFDPHASMELSQRIGLAPSTARFYVPTPEQWLEALLDFIMVSPDIAARAPHWRIWHPLDDPAVARTEGLSQALLDASDHFPVTMDLP